MKRHAATLVAAGAAGFFADGAEGAAIGVIGCTAVLFGCWWFRTHTQVLPGPEEQAHDAIYADFDEFVERLDDLARVRNWDLDKHFAIARMACTNRTMTFEELEHRYDRGSRSAPDKIRRDTSEAPKNDLSV